MTGRTGGSRRKPATRRLSERLAQHARTLRRDAHALWLAARDPRMPRRARWLAVALTAYALSPIDLIPDVVPVLGLLDDLVIVPLGLLLVARLAPPALMAECRRRAAESAERPAARGAVAFVVATWCIACPIATVVMYRLLSR